MQPLEHLVARMDAMTCRSSRTCSTCEHADRFGGCRLEDAIGAALAPAPAQARRARSHLRLHTRQESEAWTLPLAARA